MHSLPLGALILLGTALGWEESREAFGARLRDAAREANTKYDVDGLCRDFPSRIADLKARSGDRLGK